MMPPSFYYLPAMQTASNVDSHELSIDISLTTNTAPCVRDRVAIPAQVFAICVASLTSSVMGAESRWDRYLHDGTADAQINARPIQPRNYDIHNTHDMLTHIRRCLGVSKVDLARICTVSRQTIYDWLAGKYEAESDKTARLRQLYELAEIVQNRGRVSLDRKNIHIDLLDTLQADRIDMTRARSLIEESFKLQKESIADRHRRFGWSKPSKLDLEQNLEYNLQQLELDGI